MKWWHFRENGQKQTQRQDRIAIPFPDDIEDLATLKYHGLRSLCGFLMDRHTVCRSPHPFCGGAQPFQLIVHPVLQRNATDGTFLIGTYFTRAKSRTLDDDSELPSLLEYVVSWGYADSMPGRKAVVNLVDDGSYFAQYGPIVNPVESDFSTGQIDANDTRSFYCDPEPAHTKWEYWTSKLTEGQLVVPEYRCILAGDEWSIIDIDREKGFAQPVAALKLADNPKHNYGIHRADGRMNIYATENDGSEFSKVVRENLSPLG